MKYLVIVGIFIVFDIIAFILYGLDKSKAEKHAWRTPEAVLLWMSVPGGIGAFVGMKAFHHKTKKWYFNLVAGLFALIQAAIIGFIVYCICKFGADFSF
ncbi:MAG: DUF1294 domain-containing protein [Lachnospiraceae bacterium]|nr:DUF1294 domain-containing protein [Lachnospiraceae bacterium]MBR4816933.1 DUF1294 domain-containing protein [Lachnospiraceae bacterium]MCR4624727.1 DUF1294 domain-containing protein [Lachnospiraceae bacterium]